MAEVGDELRRWLALREEPADVDLSGLRTQLLAKLENELENEDLTQERKDAGAVAARRLQELVRPLHEALRSLHPRAEIGLMPDTYTRNMLVTYREAGAPEIVFSWGRLSQIGSGPDHHRYSLRMGYGLEVTDEGGLILRAFIDVGHQSIGGNDFHWEAPSRTAPVGSVAADEMLREGIAELGAQLERAAAAFTAGVPGG